MGKNAKAVGIEGSGDEGPVYSSREELWQRERRRLDSKTGKLSWYEDALNHWAEEAQCHGPTDAVVMGGNHHLHSVDCKDSIHFLQQALRSMSSQRSLDSHLVALDCGAGVGRVAASALLPLVHEVDLVEPVTPLLDEAKRRLLPPSLASDDAASHAREGRIASRFYYEGLQDFAPEPDRYDIIWIRTLRFALSASPTPAKHALQ